MPSLTTLKRLQTARTVGQAIKQQSDTVMEATWTGDIGAKECYIYDYYHDDQPEINQGFTYKHTSKTPIAVKFMISGYGSMSKDAIECYVQFIPSQKVYGFEESDPLYYYQTDFADKYGANFPVGLYIDIPNEKGVYERWLICKSDYSVQFTRHLILRCDYKYQWIEELDGKRVKRELWGCTRSQNSYNSGLWTDTYTTTQEDQEKFMVPLNSLTEYFSTVHPSGSNQRMLVGAPTKNIKAWVVSKIQDNQPRGVKTVTLYQTEVKQDYDLIDVENKEFFADYYKDGDVLPKPEVDPDPIVATAVITATSSTIKVGGSYKTLTLAILKNDEDVTSEYLDSLSLDNWSYSYKDMDTPEGDEFVKMIQGSTNNKIKVKLGSDRSFIGKVLVITCTVTEKIIGTVELDITAL